MQEDILETLLQVCRHLGSSQGKVSESDAFACPLEVLPDLPCSSAPVTMTVEAVLRLVASQMMSIWISESLASVYLHRVMA